jgi:surface antigen
VAGAFGRHCRLYNGCTPARLWRGLAAGAVLSLALAAGGCSMTYQLDSFFGGSDKSDITGSITPPPGAKAVAKMPPDGDLAYARAAATEVLRRGKKDASLPWVNPHSGARGTVTPIASAYTDDGRTCQDFLASYVNDGAAAWLHGEACKQDNNSWQVRSLRPWQAS